VAERIVTLWIGARLGRTERACLRAALRHGHEVALYTYGDLAGVPEGVERRDAAAILPEARMLRYPNGSVAIFANWFRYELLRRGAGIWMDTDSYLLAPLRDAPDHLFGWEEEGRRISNGVLRLPSDSPILDDLLALFEERVVPAWLPLHQRLLAALRLLRTGRTGVELMPWGSTGPRALTALARRYGAAQAAVPPSRYYPVHYRDAGWIRDPGRSLEAMIAPDTVAVHLWNELIKDWKDAPAPAGSFLARLQAEGE